MQQEIERDIKTALLAGDKEKTETLKGLKSALQYEAVALKTKPENLSLEQVQKVFAREAKRRQEAFTMYDSAGEADRAAKESREKQTIDKYLPAQIGEHEIKSLVTEEIVKLDAPSMADMGKIIGAVKARAGTGADGATIARIVKDGLSGQAKN
jgi:uncharacterized protein YqeY